MCIFDVSIDMVGYAVARLVVPIISFHWIYVEPLSAPIRKFNWLGYRYDESGRVEIASTVAGFVGLILGLLAFIALGLLTRASL